MSPRRSSRSKTSQPTQHTNSSSSSVSSGRFDSRSRSTNKLTSPRTSHPPKSPSAEDRDASSNPQARETRSSQETLKTKAEEEEADEEDGGEEDEEEITRCVCGQQDYPGLPIAASDPTKTASKAHGTHDDTSSPATLQEDTGGLFIQCDSCKVWQHGGCVGIMNEPMTPDEYFCEQCRKDLHSITSTANGQKRSLYLPVQDGSSPEASPSPAPPENPTRRTKESRSSRLNAEDLAGKRRSTMNSRDSAYYEAEQIRRAIEESKKEGGAAAAAGSRGAKRSRDESDEGKDDKKRQRTKSGSSASSNEKPSAQEANEEEADKSKPIVPSAAKPIRGAAARNHRNKELRDLEEKREKERADAAGRRKGRAERRRGDGNKLNTDSVFNILTALIESDPSEEPLSRTGSSKGAEKAHTETVTPPQTQPAPKNSHHKKTGRPPTRRGRLGRNQYTRDRDLRPDALKNQQDGASPSRSNNSKEDNNPPRTNGNHVGPNGNGEPGGKASKPRQMNPSRTSMNDMKRRVAGILDFISHTQVELAAEVPLVPQPKKLPSTHATITAANVTVTPPDDDPDGRKDDKGGDAQKQPADQQQQKGPELTTLGAELNVEHFRKLGSLEMMEVLSSRLIKWQREYGKFGEKS
ncbi:MAG: hypothetical protein L6R37_000598 [Teloschistes peruensis]|nr:MAG: hypothetical protein L6R37_000598 [Teloschistes peruensis]